MRLIGANTFLETQYDVDMKCRLPSVMGKLPATSYVRLVDIWLIFGQLIPFVEERKENCLNELTLLLRGGGTLCPSQRFFALNPNRRSPGVTKIADFSANK